ncbi:DNA polymerase III subunit alpha [Candidatus Kaiserbacteria bacterium RIFCSPHIGHO2_01_FULL_46_22]|uniref:DNA polymerase III subunit alpha n=1 Tax=Candidatus Kaiserbacteria bacterium RIFCSPHIGHO2_01_FULL_46_22 TaxID=1798475 RepID=A0A1F6BY59_9BACT|nr:MAG: DNA polymerase III subunit alpha [Candidatus Kaiserbacteria bacterium RIFCSPHIGHO2_01_FULL_46_22]
MSEKRLQTEFVHLHVHSHYSLLNALPTPKELAYAAKADGQDALALTDNGALYGMIDFYKACQKEDIKPIIGLDAFLSPRTRFDKDAGIDKPRSRLVLLAKNNVGYQNLIELVTRSFVDGFYYKPRLDQELLEKHKEGLIAILPSFAGEVAQSLKNNDQERAGEKLDWYRHIYSEDCYLEVTNHPELLDHGENQERIKALAKVNNVPLVAAHDVYYINPEDRVARETLLKIQNGGVVDTSADGNEDFSFVTTAAIKEKFLDVPEAVSNTVKIAESCNVDIPIGTTWYFPNYIIESGKEPDDELKDLAYKGVTWRGLSLEDKEVQERLNYELEVIKMKGYAKYFLVVGDLLRESRVRGILTTIRGSVAGSLTTYVLGITNVDPLEYKLPFERFLNPERPSAPDIDMDFADNRRDEIIEYAKQKYGEDKVAQIGTFGTMMARAAVRDVARALGHVYATGDRIAKLIPIGSQGFPMTIKRALEIEPELAKMYKSEPEMREVLDLAKQIEGRVRHLGVHAAGVVIAPEPLNRFVPVQPDPKTGKLITQYEMRSVGEDGVGLLKFDFLGIKNLAILADAVKRVKKIRNIEVDIENIPLDDKLTFEMLARGETMGLFQLNGSGMTSFLKQLQPSSIHDINAMVALYRPGPMESIPQYIERKHNAALIHYMDPRLETILDRSYGVITYQDDVMMTAITLAGYSWLDADKLRKAMGKKIPEVMEAEKEKLLKGFVEYGKLSGQKAEQLWKLIEPFAAYGFNKAHAASYGRVAYQTAYMKANYPVEYMSAVLTADSGDTEKISEIIHECERMGIEVLPPDINESFADFSVVPGTQKIRFGLTTIKNFGAGISDSIIEERKTNGQYHSLSDFLTRVRERNLNKKSLEALIETGALDRFKERGLMFANLETLLEFNKNAQAAAESSQDSLFGGTSISELSLNPSAPIPMAQKLAWEKDLLGVYVSGHPLDSFAEELKKRPTIKVIREDGRNGIPVVTAGMVGTMRELLTKKGEKMAFIQLVNKTDQIEVTAFPETYRALQEVLRPSACVAIKGRLQIRSGEPTVMLENAKLLTSEVSAVS